MRAYQLLPEGYEEKYKMDLQKDKKTAMKVNALAAVFFIVLMILGCFIVPILEFTDAGMSADFFIKMAVLVAGYIAYIILHELTHAMVMKAVGAKQVRFGFTGLYAYAGSEEDYFDKTSYGWIALAPVLIWGIIFGLLTVMAPRDWFWIVWFLQAGNIGGAAGDIYVTARLRKEPETILVRDTGLEMTVYDKE